MYVSAVACAARGSTERAKRKPNTAANTAVVDASFAMDGFFQHVVKEGRGVFKTPESRISKLTQPKHANVCLDKLVKSQRARPKENKAVDCRLHSSFYNNYCHAIGKKREHSRLLFTCTLITFFSSLFSFIT